MAVIKCVIVVDFKQTTEALQKEKKSQLFESVVRSLNVLRIAEDK